MKMILHDFWMHPISLRAGVPSRTAQTLPSAWQLKQINQHLTLIVWRLQFHTFTGSLVSCSPPPMSVGLSDRNSTTHYDDTPFYEFNARRSSPSGGCRRWTTRTVCLLLVLNHLLFATGISVSPDQNSYSHHVMYYACGTLSISDHVSLSLTDSTVPKELKVSS